MVRKRQRAARLEGAAALIGFASAGLLHINLIQDVYWKQDFPLSPYICGLQHDRRAER